MKLGNKKLLWMSLDEVGAFKNTNEWEWYDALLNGKVVGHHKQPYPYQENYVLHASLSEDDETANTKQ